MTVHADTTSIVDALLEGALLIGEAVFTTLLGNSVAGTYVDYGNALETGAVDLSALVWLARKGDIPFALFLAPLAFRQSTSCREDQETAGRR